ncbi:MAG TPA: GFA family protein [Mesorhizobium sp.]|uniref:GFA family protein n=1 Tax=Mesorhizobium sp. TaxID=1871066 RepID=UPI002DDCD9B0|nr:GFA family protein [Mesorhizobium sp.]HEV2503633.1 GFA family protein [Mesorhizobium sp.]
MQRHGGCLCGQIRYSVSTEPRVHYCHCAMCRRATGSAYAVLCWVDRTAVSWAGAAPAMRRSSPLASRSFCDECGTPIALLYDGSAEIALHGGTFDDPNTFRPTYNYGGNRRLDWVCDGMDLPDYPITERW